MAEIFKKDIGGVDLSGATFVRPGVKDDSQAQQLAFAAKTAADVGERVAVRQLRGEATNFQEVEADQELLQEPTEAIDTLTKLTAARRAGLPTSQARTRAAAILRQNKSSLLGAFFSDELDRAAADFFGGSGFGSGGIFEPTAQEKAVAKFEAEVTDVALRNQISMDAARELIKKKEDMARRSAEIDVKIKERNFNAGDFAAFNNMRLSAMSADMVATLTQRSGQLSPEDQDAFINDINRLAAAQKRVLTNNARGENGQLLISNADYQTELTNIDQWVTSMSQLVKDNDLKTTLKDNSEILSTKIDLFNYKNFSDIVAINRAGGQAYLQYVIETVGKDNKTLEALVKSNNPIAKRIITGFQDGTISPANILMEGAKGLSMGGELTDQQLAGGATLLNTQGSSNQVGELLTNNEQTAIEALRQIMGNVPESIVGFTTPEYASRINSDRNKWEPALKASVQGVFANIYQRRQATLLQNGDVPTLGPIQITRVPLSVEAQRAGGILPGGTQAAVQAARGGPSPELRIEGDGVDSRVRGQVRDLVKVAETFPFLWEGEFDNSLDYVQHILTNGANAPAPQREEVEGPPEETSSVLSPEDQAKRERQKEIIDSLGFGTSESGRRQTEALLELLDSLGFGTSESGRRQTKALGDLLLARGEPEVGEFNVDVDGVIASLSSTESGGDTQAQFTGSDNRSFVGRLQFGKARLQDAKEDGVIPKGMTQQEFRNDVEAQQNVERWHVEDIAEYITRQGLDDFVGQTINGVTVTPQGMIAVAHLGGKSGLKRHLESGGKFNPEDELGTSLSDYMRKHANG